MSAVRGGALAAALVVASTWGALADASDLVAERITRENAAERLIGGPDAVGGIGDWYLANDVVEVIVDDAGRRHGKLNHGGTIVDAGLRGRDGDDQFARLFPVVNMDQRVLLNYDAVHAEVDPGGGWARLVVSSRQGMGAVPRGGAWARRLDPLVPDGEEIRSVLAETAYTVRPGEPFVRILTVLRNAGDAPAPIFAYGDVWMRGGRSMRSFVGNTLEPARSRGFQHRSFDRHDILGASEAMAPFTFVAMAGLPHFTPVAYALFFPERAARGMPGFGVTGTHVNFVNGFVFDPAWDEVGLWRLLRATRRKMAPGAAWSFERRLLVTGGSDVAASTDLILPLLGVADGSSGIRGRVEPSGVRAVILVERITDAAPVTQAATSVTGPGAGRYSAVLPPGDYMLTFRAAHRAPRRVPVTVVPGVFAEAPPQRFEEPGALRFSKAFADGGPGRLIVAGLAGTPDPVFDPELLDFRIDGAPAESATEINEIHFLGGGRDPERVALPPGRYRLIATRGPEFDLAQLDVEVTGPGAELVVAPFALRRVVSLPGFTSADLHVHGQASDDSGMPNSARLRSFVAEAVDVMVSSDHDHVGRFGPALDALGLRDRIRVIHGVEVTSSAPSPAAPWTIGHHNAWPVPYRPLEHRKGSPPSQGLTVAELYASLRRDHGAQVVQLNHPLDREPGVDEGHYLTHLGRAGEAFDPSQPVDAAPNRLMLEPASDGNTRAIDFDAVEVMNSSSFDQYRRVREIWYALLRQGFRRTATGNSDTHGPGERAAYPRNYVAAGAGAFDAAGFHAAIRDGRLFATTGPLVTAFRANGGGMGDLVAATKGRVEVQLAVSAAPWVPVDEVRLLVNGEPAHTWRKLAEPDKVMRLLRTVKLALKRDAFLTVEAGAPLDVDPARWIAERGGVYASRVAPGFVSQALANPIYVDVDGNGRFDPPGLPAAPATRRLLLMSLLLLTLAFTWWRLRARSGLARRP